MPKSRYPTQLRRKLDAYFSEEELRTLCFDMGVDYDALPGRGKGNKTRDLVSLLARNDRIPELTARCAEERSNVTWTFEARLFISYKRNSEPDEALAKYLHEKLSADGHQIFIDTSMRTGTDWLNEIDRQIKESDSLIVLLSKSSANSEMVQAEIQRAYSYRKLQNYPDIIPVRIAYEGLLPYSIDAFLNPYQYAVWDSAADNDLVYQSILDSIAGVMPDQEPIQIPEPNTEITLSEDGLALDHDRELHPPLPEVDPRILDDLVVPGGTVRLRDAFYIDRKADSQLKRQVERPGSITTIRASRQTGKSSLLLRGIHHSRQKGVKVVNLDLQQVDSDELVSPDVFLKDLAYFFVRKLRLDRDEVDKMWQSPYGHQDKITFLMEDYILPEAGGPVILAIDEADRLLETGFYSDFFGLVRFWHNNAAYDDLWELLSIVLVISTEPYLLIASSDQSPFNVGLKLYLQDFDESQVTDLNRRHGSPVADGDFAAFMKLLNGHPYLTRNALYTMVSDQIPWSDFLSIAATDQGPFSDHLRRQLWLLRDQPALQAALKQIIRHNRCDDQSARFRLVQAGLAISSGETCRCRCDLYRDYFKDKLA
jgi:hypothetical protein